MWKPGLKEIVYDSTTKSLNSNPSSLHYLYEVNWDSLELIESALEEYAGLLPGWNADLMTSART